MWLWIGFLLLVGLMLALDLGVFNRGDHVFTTREALRWTAVWVALSLVFSVVVYFMYEHHWLGIGVGSGLDGRDASIEFLTGYVIEKSLSLDNIFVMALIFQYFRVPPQYQHRVLFWGILGALIMRGLMIAAGSVLLSQFTWTIYLFGGFLIFTAFRMLMGSTDKVDPEHNLFLRLVRRVAPVTKELHGHAFFVRQEAGAGVSAAQVGKLAVTPLFLVLLVVESTDVVFAVDSIPAIFAITQDTYLVFTSNIFAILGLRSLYFALASMLGEFRYLKQSLVIVLAFVGVKMIASHHLEIPPLLSLGIIALILGAGVAASIFVGRKAEPPDLPG